MDTKILLKYQQTKLRDIQKKIENHDQIGFIIEMQVCFNICKTINVVHYIYDIKGEKAWDHPKTLFNKS